MTALSDFLPPGAALLVSAHADDKVLSHHDGAWTEISLPGPRGISAAAGGTSVVTRDAIVVFNEAGMQVRTLHVGPLFGHEVIRDQSGITHVCAAAYSALRGFNDLGQDLSIWRVPGVDPSDDNRSHINGIAALNGQPRYVTCLGLSNTANGWRERAAVGQGVLLDVVTGQVVLEGLTMPHSPRCRGEVVYFLNSGLGQLCSWAPGDMAMSIRAALPGFARGLVLTGEHALVGISQGRGTAMPAVQTDPFAQPGIAVINLGTGALDHFETLDVQEIFDVQIAAAPLVRHP